MTVWNLNRFSSQNTFAVINYSLQFGYLRIVQYIIQEHARRIDFTGVQEKALESPLVEAAQNANFAVF